MISYISNILKGALMGAANVIPGVSGGTMALLTGIFERLINAIKSFDMEAIKLGCTFKFKELFEHIDFKFLSAIGIGVLVSILSVAQLLKYLFKHHDLYVWSFFFGLILASVFFVFKTIKKIKPSTIVLFVLGTAIAATFAFIKRAEGSGETSFAMWITCGAIASCSMILPGLSGSFILLLMGKYQTVLDSISLTKPDLGVLIPVGLGAIIGLAAFSRILSWIFKKFHDQAIALLTGFIFGSLAILWPWKEAITEQFDKKIKIVGYKNYSLPELNAETGIAIAIMLAGIIIIAAIELSAGKLKTD